MHSFLVSFVNILKISQSLSSWVLFARLYDLFFLLQSRLHATVTQGWEYLEEVNFVGTNFIDESTICLMLDHIWLMLVSGVLLIRNLETSVVTWFFIRVISALFHKKIWRLVRFVLLA